MYLTTAHVFFHDSSENLTNLGMLIAERFENVSDNEWLQQSFFPSICMLLTP